LHANFIYYKYYFAIKTISVTIINSLGKSKQRRQLIFVDENPDLMEKRDSYEGKRYLLFPKSMFGTSK